MRIEFRKVVAFFSLSLSLDRIDPKSSDTTKLPLSIHLDIKTFRRLCHHVDMSQQISMPTHFFCWRAVIRFNYDTSGKQKIEQQADTLLRISTSRSRKKNANKPNNLLDSIVNCHVFVCSLNEINVYNRHRIRLSPENIPTALLR